MPKKYIGLLALCVILVLWFLLSNEETTNPTIRITMEPDLSTHPIYSSYDFSPDDSVIHIGLQPLYLPASWIFEVVRRDSILEAEISKLGMELRFFSFLKGNDINFFMYRGDLDAGIGGDMPTLTIAAAGEVVISAMVQYGFTSIVANKPMLVEDLRGKCIGFAYGSNAHYTLLNALTAEGLTEEDIHLIAMETADMIKGLQSGLIDAFSSWEPTPALTQTVCPNSAVIHRGLSTGYLYFAKSFFQKHPEVVRHIVAAEIRAIGWLQQSENHLSIACEYGCEAVEQITGTGLDLDRSQTANLVMNDLLGLTTVPYIPTVLLEENGPLHREFEFLKAIGAVPNSSDWNVVRNSFDNAIIEEVLSEKRNYSLTDFRFQYAGGGNFE